MDIIGILSQSNVNRINKEYIQTLRSITIIALMKIKSSRSMVDNRINLNNMNQELVPCHILFMYYFQMLICGRKV